MGLNTIHKRSNDMIEGYDLTKKFQFNCEMLNSVDTSKLEMAQGLNFNQLKMAIRINGICNLEIGDQVEVLGTKFLVTTMSSSIGNAYQFRKRADYNNFTGETIVGLE